MEIERKFLIDWKEIDALGLPLVKQAQSWQGYLSAATPVVRIRKRDFSDGHTDYILCIKGKGKLAREEIEKALRRRCGPLARSWTSPLTGAAPVSWSSRSFCIPPLHREEAPLMRRPPRSSRR